MRERLNSIVDSLMPVLATFAALGVGAVMLLILKVNPVTAYGALWEGAFGSSNAVAETLVKATPLLLVGLGICIAFRGDVINIGGEGQMVVGAILATLIGLNLEGLPGWFVIILAMLGGFVGGAFWGGIPGVLKAYFNVNEILSTIMMNAIAVQGMNFLLRGPMIDPSQAELASKIPQTARLLEAFRLPRLVPTRLHLGAAIAVLLAILVYILLWRTTLGYRIRAVGQSPPAARYAGISVPRHVILALLFSGAFAGLAGAVQVFGVNFRMITDGSATGFTGSAGFNGIVAALFGQLHPIGTIPASVLFGALLVGANKMQRVVQVPSALITSLNGLVVVFVVSSEIWRQRRQRRRLRDAAARIEAEAELHDLQDPVAGGGGRPMIEELLSTTVLVGILASGIRLATPYLYAAIGETFGQRSGVLNLGVEGQMLLGAFAAFYLTFTTGNLLLGVLAAMVVGGLMGLAMAFVTVNLKAEQGISGIGFYLFGLGLSDLLFQRLLGTVETVRGFSRIHIPFLSDIPLLGEIFFNHNLLVYLAFALVPIAWFVLNKTTLGLKIRAVGEHPEAADSVGVSVARVRYFTIILGGVLSGVAGASLSIALLNVFQQNMTSGLGFIAVALVYFGGWRPWGVLGGALLFSMVNSLQLWIQVLGIPIPSDIAVMMPYVLTILALILAVSRVRAPSALTKPFGRDE